MTDCPPCNGDCIQGRTCLLQQQMHPSGMTLARWNWPFKTPEERELIAKWFAKEDRRRRKQELDDIDPAPF